MTSEAFSRELLELYQGEVIGEVLFDGLLAYFDDPTQRYKIAVMLQLETETKARLRPALMELNLDLAEDHQSRTLGREMALSFKGKEWEDVMVALRDVIRPYVERYKDIATGAPSEYRAIADSMVTHEQSLYDFTELELAGDTEHSEDAIVAQLRFPLPAP